MERTWWKEAVIYEIYVRSFQDSDGDGHGDLNGITMRLPYLKSLGVDAIWITPIFASPLDDMGYDISDYTGILDTFGTMEDVDRLMAEANRLGIRVILDMVLNHTSDEHPWFLESRSSRVNPKRDWYVWHPGVDGKPPNNWVSAFHGPAWTWDEHSGEYYLHQFSPKQPDLNWRHPEVRGAMFDMIRFWLNKGVAGLRLDMVNALVEDEQFRDNIWKDTREAVDYSRLASNISLDTENFVDRTRNQPETYAIVEALKREVLDPVGEIFTVGESWPCSPEVAGELAGPGRLDVCFHFDFLDLGRRDLSEFRRIMNKWETSLESRGPDAWNAWYLSNHDMPRSASVFGSAKHPKESAVMLNCWLLTRRGTVFLYQGEEIGMTDIRYPGIEDYRDIMTINHYRKLLGDGMDPRTALDTAAAASRDNARSPMQWDDGPGAGFTTGSPWLGINANHKWINVSGQLQEDDSILARTRELIMLRKSFPTLVYGAFRQVETDSDRLDCVFREDGDHQFLVVLNFSEEPARCRCLEECTGEAVFYSDQSSDSQVLGPFGARIYQLR